ncbi:hypothetical protein RCO27_11805 [Sphingosinicella sp. LHD-64]|uniref:hypothetical protein n=1 Tax=Sphingosinicella sp. LHD-64 TaxID=3072139 RepID=UPI00280CD8F4|nr:hypothetical protein [Sphingosinicella sp. LHD-64]MDQ8756911.1 hypothetical protein [Sphingosinicella sp. LHD-64]
MTGIAIAVAGCSASHANSAIAATATPQCAVSASASVETLERPPTVLSATSPGALRLDRSHTLTGTCAREARSFEMGQILFADGSVKAIGEDGSLSTVGQRPTAVEPSALSSQEGPRLEGAPLVYAARVGARREGARLVTSYVGVWTVGGKSVVASFKSAAGEQPSTPQPLLESQSPILGVGYFPAADAPSGQLGVVQQVSSDTARLLNYQWFHPDL